MADLAPRQALYCHAPVASGPDLLHDNLAYFATLEARCRAALARDPAPPVAEGKLEDWAAFPFEAAVPARWPLDGALPDDKAFYRDAHQRAIRAMASWLAQGEP